MKEKEDLKYVLGSILQMMQHYQNVVNSEALRILHNTGYCQDYVETCPICVEEFNAAKAGEEE